MIYVEQSAKILDSFIAQLEQRVIVSGKQPPHLWQEWLRVLFPSYVDAPFADRHIKLWDWADSLPKHKRPAAFVAIWPRGGGKSTTTELAAVYIGAKRRRRYCLYVCESQDQADDHVSNIASMLESDTFAEYYPKVASRKVGKYGSSKGWRRNRIRTDSGFTIDAMGLDSAKRGAKLEEDRPDLIIIDDIDHHEDKPEAVRKKERTITQKILQAGASNLAVLFVQNMVHINSVMARLSRNESDLLARRVVSGPYPAIEKLTYKQEKGRFIITGGTATWQGQSIDDCQSIINTVGLSSFLKESQHEVQAPPGGIWDHVEFQHCEPREVPDIVRYAVWVDPAVTDTDQSDSHALQIDGLGSDDRIYRFYSWEQRTSPEQSIRKAILKAVEYGAPYVGIETDQGGDVWIPAFEKVLQDMIDDADLPHINSEATLPGFRQAKAGAGHGSKVHRNSLMLAAYERGQVIHVTGTHDTLERALRRFPKTKPLDLADAAYWAWNDLAEQSSFFL